jgi:hypothetical protein
VFEISFQKARGFYFHGQAVSKFFAHISKLHLMSGETLAVLKKLSTAVSSWYL